MVQDHKAPSNNIRMDWRPPKSDWRPSLAYVVSKLKQWQTRLSILLKEHFCHQLHPLLLCWTNWASICLNTIHIIVFYGSLVKQFILT